MNWCVIRKCLDSENRIVSNVTRNGTFFQPMKSIIGRNAQCLSDFVEHSVHKMPDVNMFERVDGSLPTSVFDLVGVLRELLCMQYGYFSQALLST